MISAILTLLQVLVQVTAVLLRPLEAQQLEKHHKQAKCSQLPEAQRGQVMAAQTLDGKDCSTDEGSFERWIEPFEERAKIAGWKGEQKLKAHLKKTAEHAFRMMPAKERGDYNNSSTQQQRYPCLETQLKFV